MNQNRPDDERTIRTTRIVTLDFNGGSHVYRNPELGMNIPVRIAPSGISAERARMLTEALNKNCADSHVRFEVGMSSEATRMGKDGSKSGASEENSTVRIGHTTDFDRYGAFLGLAEGIGSGDAFVLLDDSANDAELVDVIRHEAGHILGTLDHGGAGLARYAYYTTVNKYVYTSLGANQKSYIREKYTTNRTFGVLTPQTSMDELLLEYDESYTIVENVYDGYYGTTPPETSSETTSRTDTGYITASGVSARNISIKGGSATNCTATTISVTGKLICDSVSYKQNSSNEPYDQSYSNLHFYQGVANSCAAGALFVSGNAVASSCTATKSIRVGGMDYGDLGSGNRALVENCSIIGGSLIVTAGGDANHCVIHGDAYSYAYIGDESLGDYHAENGKAVAKDLVINGGGAVVGNYGELHNATINGELSVTGEGGATLSNVTCTSVNITSDFSGSITIKLDLRDYAVANYSDVFRNDKGDIVKKIEYFSNYTTRTTDYTYTYVPGADAPYVTTTVSYGVFDNNDHRFDMSKWSDYTFVVYIGKVYEPGICSKINLDLGRTEKGFAWGLILCTNGNYNSIPFGFSGDKNKWKVSNAETTYPYEDVEATEYYYDATIFGEAADVLWLENGWNDEAEYVVALPAEVMSNATENLTITSSNHGAIGEAEVKNGELVISGGASTGNFMISAEDSGNQKHTCALELLVVPESIPVIGKEGTKKYAEMLKKAQQGHLTTVKDVLPNNIHTKFFGMSFDLTNMGLSLTVNWTEPSITLVVQGKMEWVIGKGTAGTGKQLKLVVDLSGENYISITSTGINDYSWDLVGELKVPDFKLGKFEFSNMSLKVNVEESAFSVSAYVKLPWIKYSFGGSIGIVDGYLDSMAIGVDGLNAPVGTSGLFLQKIEGGIKGIATEENLTFEGTLGLTAGPKFSVEFVDWLGLDDGEYSLCELTLTGSISTAGDLEGGAEITILGGLAKGEGKASISGGAITVTGEFTFLNGCISIKGKLHASNGGITITGTGSASLPREKIFGPLAGYAMTANVAAVVNQSASSSYVMAWQNITIFNKEYTIGFKSTFEGSVSMLGATDLLKEEKRNLRSLKSISVQGNSVAEPLRGETPVKSEKYTVTDSGMTFFQVYLSVSGASMSLSYDGLEFTQADIAAGTCENMQIVSKLSGETCITVAVDNAALGEWTISAYGDENATFSAYTLVEAAPKPVISAVEVDWENNSATIRYTLGNLSALENATISVFLVNGDSTEYTGARIAEFAAAEANGVFEFVADDELPGGSYAFYLMVTSDNLAPSFSEMTAAYKFNTIDIEAPDQVQVISSEWKSTGTVISWEEPWDDRGVAGYRIRYTAGDEDMAEADVTTNSFTFDNVPNGTYDFQVAAYDAAGNQSEWSEMQSVLVLTVANAKYKDVTLNEALELAEYESSVNITAGDFAVTTAANSLISGSVLTDATIRGIVESTTVNGKAQLLDTAQGYGLTVNGELFVGDETSQETDDTSAEIPVEGDSTAAVAEVDFTVAAVVDGATVTSGGKLTVGRNGKASNVSAKAGGTVELQNNAEFTGLVADYGATVRITGNDKYLLTDDIRVAGTLNAWCVIDGNGYKIRFEQYKQTAEYEEVDGGVTDNDAFTINMDKFPSRTLEIEVDSSVYGNFKIAEKAKFFTGTVTIVDHADGSSDVVGFDRYALVGKSLYKLYTDDKNALWLLATRSEIGSPTLSVIYAEDHAYGEVKISASSAETAGRVKKYSYRYSLNADMTEAVTVVSDYATFLLDKSDLVDNATYYVQGSVENTEGVKSLWSDPVSFTVVPKILPEAPTALSVTGATNANETSITITVGGYDRDEYTIRGFRFRYATNPEMENAVNLPVNDGRYNDSISIDKSTIEDGKDYWVEASILYGNDWSEWSDAVVFNTQGWDFENITVGTGGAYEEIWLSDGKKARNITVTENGRIFGDRGGIVDNITVDGGYLRVGSAATNLVLNSGEITLDENSSVTDLVANGGSVRPMYGTLNGATIGANALLSLTSNYTPTITGTILIQGRMEVYNYHPGLSTDAAFVFDIGAHESETMKDKMFIDFTSPLLGSRTFTVKLDDTPEAGDYTLTYVPNSGEFYTRLAAADGTDLGLMSLGGEAIQHNDLYYSLIELNSRIYLHVSEDDGPVFLGKVKLSKDGTVYDSSNSYSKLTVSAASECDHVLVEDGGRLQMVTVGDGGSVDVYGEVWGATIEKGGKLTMNSGCVLADRPVNIQKGGEIVVNGGKINMGAKFKIAGAMTVNSALQSYEESQTSHEFIFALDQLAAPNTAVMISDYELVKTCDANFSVSVSANQAAGTYKLMGNAAAYSSGITVYYEGGPSYGSYLWSGGSSEFNGKNYSIAVKNNILTLTVGGGSANPVEPDNPGNDNPLKEDGSPNLDAVEDNPLTDGSTKIVMDEEGTVDGGEYNNSVGGTDRVDYARVSLEKAAKLSFTVKADSKVKLTFYELVEKTDGTYKKKSLKSVTVSSKKGGEKTTASVLVNGGSDKLYYVAVENKNSQSKGAYYNVSLTTEGKNACEFFSDGDNGDNKYLYDKKQKDVWNSNVLDADALVIDDSFLEEGKRAIQIDTDAETVVNHDGFTNFVGFGDAMDFRKIELKSAAKLSFDLTKTTGGAAKLIVYTVNDSGKMVVASSKLTMTVKAAASSGMLKNQVVLQKGVYYIAVQSTDAKKGKEAYYNVSLNENSVFYEHGDLGKNNFNSKTKKVDDVVRKDENAVTLHVGDKLRLDGLLDGETEINETKGGIEYLNFVGTGDDSDVVRINANDGMKLSLKVTATDAVSLVVYGLQKNGTLKALKTVKSKNNVAELNDFELKAKSASGGQFFLGVTSTNAKKGSAAYYNVDVVDVSGQNPPLSSSEASSLAMPETDNLGISDALSLGQYDADVLADASASALADLDSKSGWQSLLA